MVTGAMGTWYWVGPTHVNPTDLYYWTQKFSEAGVDIQSPNSKAIIKVEAYPKIGWPMYREELRTARERCDLSARNTVANAGGPVIGGTEWRGVTLCNTANLSKDEFEVAKNYFKARVDEDYSRFYSGTARDWAAAGLVDG
jgi:hypothetical protein